MELSSKSQDSLINFQWNSDLDISNIRKPAINHLNQDLVSQTLTIEELRAKKSAILNKTNNDPKTEQDFRRICKLYENQNFDSDLQLTLAYQEYVKAYHQIASLYLIDWQYNKTTLIIYDTESEREGLKVLETPEWLSYATCIAQLPYGELFCSGNNAYPASGITLKIDSHYNIRLLPSGTPCGYSSAIYFNRSVYCFGGSKYNVPLNLSSRFDFDQNRWIKLIPMPLTDFICNIVIFKGNIIISRYKNRNLLKYSIDIDSFSSIPYEFAKKTRKKLIEIEGRLYLIGYFNKKIYESEIWDEYTWKKIGTSKIPNDPYPMRCLYNKGGIYIITSPNQSPYKFDLSKKVMSRL
ncbi:unnamed protein product [Blepharisma stoltei]|uniref:Uncharacterized protein n=1 Tax=Blepharisma stoltei TaxID=1481888 RepID=A0AAU9K6R0_9CILI|nr:unnamed protein product [Blepharisma stoltei]